MNQDQVKIFNHFLTHFAEAEFPLMLSYNVQEPESFYDEPLSAELSDLFLGEDSDNEPYNEFVPVVKFKVNKQVQACIIWKASTAAYEFILYLYDLEGNILEYDSIAGVYYASDPIQYKVAEFIDANQAFIIENTLDPNLKSISPGPAKQFKLLITELGELSYIYLENKLND